ncbi:hypothetical protein TSACC_2106 [Terrimicrobium sacchariphilum]|uniref:Uncharacterized protein n=1 Tax=Terrimicrobium sacchariphilum TaxID=690879 RepID=A0A146G2K2_TERSA|nr:hypothetical protein [Terrimicrobium sacchariphilum]GAT31712.1 hypothetical protein TSACC_2106 [Terrimicrobium sacchariphilum]
MLTSLAVKLRSLLLASLLVPVLAYSQPPVDVLKPFNYEQAATLAKERLAANLDLKTLVIVLGPVRNIETRTIDGKETILSIPYFQAFRISEVRNPEILSRYMGYSDSGKLHLAVYRANQSLPVVQIAGTPGEVYHSQFPFSGGDIIVIEDASKQTPAKK